MSEEEKQLTAKEKVAILMIALGEDAAGDIMRHLNDKDVEVLAQTIAELATVTTDEEAEVLEEFEQLLRTGKFVSEGGADFARGAIEMALGPEKAGRIMSQLGHRKDSGFEMLRDIDPREIVPFVSKEHPQTVALILSQMAPGQAAGVFTELSEQLQADVAYRMTQIETVDPDVLKELEEGLADELKHILSDKKTRVGGVDAVADMLNQAGRSTEQAVLQGIDLEDPELAEQIRNRMFTFDDIGALTTKEIQTVLKEIDNNDLVLALKGASEDVRSRIFACVSERAAATLKEDMEFVGSVRRSEADEAQIRIVQTVRRLEEEGQVTVVRGDAGNQFI